MFSIFASFQDIVGDIEVVKYDVEENQIRLHVKLRLKDSSQLVIRDYKFRDNTRKYSYHWMDKDGGLLIRWDNVPHWKNISTFPHHKHVDHEDNVIDSIETDIESALNCIRERLK